MHGYPQLSFWIPKALTHSFKPSKNILVLVGTTHRNPSISRCAERMRSNKSRHRPLLVVVCYDRAPSKEVVNYDLDLSLNIETLVASSGYQCLFHGNRSNSCSPCPLGTYEGESKECIACPAGETA